MAPYVLRPETYRPEHEGDVGGKAANLFRLRAAGLPVPELICITARAFDDCTRPVAPEIAATLASVDPGDPGSIADASRRVKGLVLGCALLPEIAAALEEGLRTLRAWDRLSVRSSASCEDGRRTSFAGQLGTWLHVPREQVPERVRACWASGFEPGILTYLHRMGVPLAAHRIAVVVQRMVDARSAGVLFQADPRGGTNRIVIAAGLGLGEGVVAGKVEADQYVYDKLQGTWDLEVAEKRSRLDGRPEGGVAEGPVDERERSRPVLSDAERAALLQRSALIAGLYDHYQDVEWAFDASGRLFILQSRPITTIPRGQRRVFDNSNIIESYPGVVSPMTFSIFQLDYRLCVREALLLCGVPRSVVDRREDALKHLVGYIHGRAYYDMGSWYRVMLLAPFFRKRIVRSFEQMIGSEGSFERGLDDLRLGPLDRARLKLRFPVRFVWNLLRHEALIRRYFKASRAIRSEALAIDLERASSDELIGHLVRLAPRFMRLLGIPMVNDFFAMLFMTLTRERFKATGVADAEALLNRLLIGQELESTRPVRSMEGLAASVRSDPALERTLSALLEGGAGNDVGRLAGALRSAGHERFADAISRHLDAFGHRSPRELIMEADTFRENPRQLLRIVVAMARSAPPGRAEEEDPGARLDALLARARRPRLVRWLLSKTRRVVAHRESTRLDRGLHFAHFRTLLHRIGARLVEEGALEGPRDVFHLTLDELEAYRAGCSPNGDLKGLVRYRAEQEAAWREADPAGRLFTSGPAYQNPLPSKPTPPADRSGALRGTGCAGGVTTAEARIVRDPNAEADVRGRILVSETTDPGWVFLMTISAGLISERGSLLSHTAIIGRELGIPTVVGVRGATRIIRDGDDLTMDGRTGTVRIGSGGGGS